MTIQAIAFDAYGTLLDVHSIAVLAERLYPGQGAALSTLWRAKQIEYSQLRTLCAMYKPFWEVTQDALVFSCRRLGLDLSVEATNALMGQYARLPAFAEALPVLRELRARGIKTAILSNGNPQMLDAALKASELEDCFHHVLSVDGVKKFKTAPEAYQLAPDVFGLSAKNILFVSGNGWDVSGAAWFGYTTFWVNRAGLPFEELGVTPHGSGADLNGVLDFVRADSSAVPA